MLSFDWPAIPYIYFHLPHLWPFTWGMRSLSLRGWVSSAFMVLESHSAASTASFLTTTTFTESSPSHTCSGYVICKQLCQKIEIVYCFHYDWSKSYYLLILFFMSSCAAGLTMRWKISPLDDLAQVLSLLPNISCVFFTCCCSCCCALREFVNPWKYYHSTVLVSATCSSQHTDINVETLGRLAIAHWPWKTETSSL